MATLVIAEKRLMGEAIAGVLKGKIQKGDGYLKVGDDTMVTWARGHLMRMAEPDEINPEWGKWHSKFLPILPEQFPYLVANDEWCIKQMKLIGNLLSQVDRVIHAGDAGREGQLIIDLILKQCSFRGDVRRLWLKANDEKTVLEALRVMRPNHEYQSLRDAAMARGIADWLFGMNLSRAYTNAARQTGYKETVSIGRVQTATLLLVVARDLEIENFKAVTYFIPTLLVSTPSGDFTVEWIIDETRTGVFDGRLLDTVLAKQIVDSCRNQTGRVENCTSKEGKLGAPMPYRLTTIQKACAQKFGLSADKTLKTVQTLYDKKLVTYPRTACSYLMESEHANAGEVLNAIGQNIPILSGAVQGAVPSLKSAAWNSAKVVEHHGIIPTSKIDPAVELAPIERQVYELIARRYLAQFYPASRYESMRVEVLVGAERFEATGTKTIERGWKVIDEADDELPENTPKTKEQTLPQGLHSGMNCLVKNSSIESSKTRPPTQYNDGTLVIDMENIHRILQGGKLASIDPLTTKPSLIKCLKGVAGIGTDATRAGMIDTLIKRDFLTRTTRGKKTKLESTPTGRALIMALPPEVKSPVLTALVEQELDLINQRKRNFDEFIAKQKLWVTSLTQYALSAPLTLTPAEKQFDCPMCGVGKLRKRPGAKGVFWGCSQYPECGVTAKDKDGEPDMATLRNKQG